MLQLLVSVFVLLAILAVAVGQLLAPTAGLPTGRLALDYLYAQAAAAPAYPDRSPLTGSPRLALTEQFGPYRVQVRAVNRTCEQVALDADLQMTTAFQPTKSAMDCQLGASPTEKLLVCAVLTRHERGEFAAMSAEEKAELDAEAAQTELVSRPLAVGGGPLSMDVAGSARLGTDNNYIAPALLARTDLRTVCVAFNR